MTTHEPLSIGLVGAGIGGVTAAVALRYNSHSKINVTILEAASELGEIGAGIQMTPNVSRLLIEYGVSDAIGDNLTWLDDLALRTKDGRKVGGYQVGRRRWNDAPWWVVHRMHLHDGLVQVAQNLGVRIITGAKVNSIDYTSSDKVTVRTEAGHEERFDLVIGSDGLNSVVRRTFLPHVQPQAPTGNAAFRATLPMDEIRADPLTRELVDRHGMDVWMGRSRETGAGYIITYPISNGAVFNMVLSHHLDRRLASVEDATLADVQHMFREYDPRIRRIIDKIAHPIKRWPLLVTRCPTWSSHNRRLVLMGDAAHSKVNHMAQGAATSMEDGAFLGILLAQHAQDPQSLPLVDAIALYERARMPVVEMKQQISYLNGEIWHFVDGSPQALARDKALEGELRGETLARSPNMLSDPWAQRAVYEYDPEEHARKTLREYWNGGRRTYGTEEVSPEMYEAYIGWYTSPRNGSKL